MRCLILLLALGCVSPASCVSEPSCGAGEHELAKCKVDLASCKVQVDLKNEGILQPILERVLSSYLINPLGLAPLDWMALLTIKIAATFLLEVIINCIAKFMCWSKMPSRDPPIGPLRKVLTWQDKCYLTVNQHIEFVFMLHFVAFLWASPYCARTWADAGVLNTIGGMYALYYLDDLIYCLAHYFLHLRPIYSLGGLGHKWHHRFLLPFRGYLDAVNESPLEQIAGLSIFFTALHLVAVALGRIHVVGACACFLFYSVFSVLNHTEYDVQVGFGLGYSNRAHEMHHRRPGCNFAKNTMFWDKLFGFYSPYVDGRSADLQKEFKEMVEEHH